MTNVDFGDFVEGASLRPMSGPREHVLIDGRYRIVSRLGAGAMGVVWRAEDVILERSAALKMIDPQHASIPTALESLLREARALARLRHDNLVQVYGFGHSEHSSFLAMEYVDGETLDGMLARQAKIFETLPLRRSLGILAATAAGLSAAHARGIVHQDVKPANIVVEHATGRAVLVDFGNARRLGEGPRSTGIGGTPSYMAPEQIRNDESVDAGADVYSLACTAFEMLTGRAVFEGTQPYEVLIAHATSEPPRVSKIRPEYAAFDPIFSTALAKASSARHDSCATFVGELSEAAHAAHLADTDSGPTTRGTVRVLLLSANESLALSVGREAVGTLRKTAHAATIERVAARSEVLAAFERNPAELVVLDDDAAGGAAIEIAACIRRLPCGRAAKIVVLTRDTQTALAVWDWLGARRLFKPVGGEVLAATFERLLAVRPQTMR